MKKTFTLLTLTIWLGLFGQEFSGRVIYQTKAEYKNFQEGLGEDKESAKYSNVLKQLDEAFKKESEKTYILEFTKNESLYQEYEKLELPSAENPRIIVARSATKKLYKNLKDSYSILEKDFIGKYFLIKSDSLHNFDWELSTETKQIGNYNVFKATRTKKPKIVENDQDTEQTSNLLDLIKPEPKNLVYTAWYSPEIPISNGPEIYGGLPGLILELHTPKKVYLCSELVINPKKTVKIKSPKGKTISEEEYRKIIEERAERSKKNEYNRNKSSR